VNEVLCYVCVCVYECVYVRSVGSVRGGREEKRNEKKQSSVWKEKRKKMKNEKKQNLLYL